MPVPKRRTSTSKRDKRRAHDSLSATLPDECPECGEKMMRHRACPHCGQYRGRQVIEIED
jgi:large subunit ribosomal protein L32